LFLTIRIFSRKEKGKRKKRNENNVPSSQFKGWIAATLFPFFLRALTLHIQAEPRSFFFK
jgi:hypothetical protein